LDHLFTQHTHSLNQFITSLELQWHTRKVHILGWFLVVLGESLGDILGETLGESLGDILGETLGDILGDTLGDIISKYAAILRE
jgi:hypothetical protein